VEGEEEGHGVCAAGDGYADAVAWVDVGAVEGERGGHRVYGSCWVLLVRFEIARALIGTRVNFVSIFRDRILD